MQNASGGLVSSRLWNVDFHCERNGEIEEGFLFVVANNGEDALEAAKLVVEINARWVQGRTQPLAEMVAESLIDAAEVFSEMKQVFY